MVLKALHRKPETKGRDKLLTPGRPYNTDQGYVVQGRSPRPMDICRHYVFLVSPPHPSNPPEPPVTEHNTTLKGVQVPGGEVRTG